MKETRTLIQNETGLHARPASILIHEAQKLQSKITIKKGEKEVNLKSMVCLLSLGVANGDEVLIRAEGVDEDEALDKVIEVIKGFSK